MNEYSYSYSCFFFLPLAAAANVTHKEIDDRLARLKGMDPARYNTSNKPVSGA